MTYISVEAVDKNRDAVCGLPENKIGCLTAESALGKLDTIWGLRLGKYPVVDPSRSQCRSPMGRHGSWGGIRAVASNSGPACCCGQPAGDITPPRPSAIADITM